MSDAASGQHGTLEPATDGRDARHAALASPLRRRILDALRDAAEPLDAAGIAEQFDLHVTTARFHLDQLEAAQLVRRRTRHGSGRGRPRVGYEAVRETSPDSALRELNSALVDALGAEPDGGRRAYAAGTRWADSYRDELTGEYPATPGVASAPGDASRPGAESDPSAAAAPLVRVFERLGFGPETRSIDGERVIALQACPFRDDALRHPEVVCSAHRGLLDGSLSELGHPAEATLEPFVTPDLCLVRLRGSLAD